MLEQIFLFFLMPLNSRLFGTVARFLQSPLKRNSLTILRGCRVFFFPKAHSAIFFFDNFDTPSIDHLLTIRCTVIANNTLSHRLPLVSHTIIQLHVYLCSRLAIPTIAVTDVNGLMTRYTYTFFANSSTQFCLILSCNLHQSLNPSILRSRHKIA